MTTFISLENQWWRLFSTPCVTLCFLFISHVSKVLLSLKKLLARKFLFLKFNLKQSFGAKHYRSTKTQTIQNMHYAVHFMYVLIYENYGKTWRHLSVLIWVSSMMILSHFFICSCSFSSTMAETTVQFPHSSIHLIFIIYIIWDDRSELSKNHHTLRCRTKFRLKIDIDVCMCLT